jgi:hypothetical protein
MFKGFIREEMIFSMKIDPKRWLILETKGRHDWNLRVVGPEPLDVYRVKLTVREAKDWAISIAKEHFRNVNPRVIVAQFQRWREAVFVERSFSPGGSSAAV